MIQPTYGNFKRYSRIGCSAFHITSDQQARTKPFEKKKESYEKHNLRMVKELCQATDWTLDEIESRESKIIAWAKTRWADL